MGAVRPVAGGVVGLAALPSASPAAGFEAGGGGLAGSVWGLFGDPGDAGGVMRAVGVQVDLGAPGWGAGAVFAVFDAGTTTQVWPASGVVVGLGGAGGGVAQRGGVRAGGDGGWGDDAAGVHGGRGAGWGGGGGGVGAGGVAAGGR